MDDDKAPGWRDLNGLQKGMALVMSAVMLAIVIPLVIWLWGVVL